VEAIGENRLEAGVPKQCEVGSPRGNLMFTFEAIHEGGAFTIFALDCLHIATTDATHPERQPVFVQLVLIGVVVDRNHGN
jgi:hypothetical protein